MERSGGTPYALVYAHDNRIESFAYPYHLNLNEAEDLLDIGESSDYAKFIPSDIKKKVILENKEIH